MQNDKVFMETDVFTEIVNNIKGAANECILPDSALKIAKNLDTFNAGRGMHELMEEIHKTADLYRKEASISLPKSLFTLRDDLIAVDDALGGSISVEKQSSGGAREI